MMTDYPDREPFFANRFIRLLVKCCVANDIGTDAFALLTTIAMTEDASHYKRGVYFYDAQLMPILGVSSASKMVRIRRKAIASGWLHFEAGRKGQCSIYWVKIPDIAENIDDAPTDEGDGLVSLAEAQVKRNESASETQVKRNESASGVILPIPNPIPVPRSEVKSEPVEVQAADMAKELWFSIPGTSKPMLPDLTEMFRAKLQWMEANGIDGREKIWSCIRDPTRDKTEVRTINQMWKFWERCGLEEKANDRGKRKNGADHYSGLEAPSL